MRTRIFVDMDDTLCVTNPLIEEYGKEILNEKGFFESRPQHAPAVIGLKQFIINNRNVEVFILSALTPTNPYCEREKHKWLDRNCNIKYSNRIFVERGEGKAKGVKGGIQKSDI